ncbi:MAG: hypothetical protein ACM33T_02555 [Solirubrobacterales bacterium]
MIRAVVVAIGLLAAASAQAGEARPRLVTGGMPAFTPQAMVTAAGDAKANLFTSHGLTLGALLNAPPSAGADGGPASGAFATYAIDSFAFTTALKVGAAGNAGEASAVYASELGRAALSLGYEWTGRPAAFSLNPWQPSLMAEGLRPANDTATLALSFTRDVTPSLSVGGFAAAVRSEYDDRPTEQGFRLGAALGYRF